MTSKMTTTRAGAHARLRIRETLAACCGFVLVSVGVARGGVWSTHGPDGGIIHSIAIAKSSSNIAFAGASGGGFYKSLDGGSTWNPIGTDIFQISALDITQIAVDPTNPLKVYASATKNLVGFAFKSTDGGATWVSPVVSDYASGIAIAPSNPSILYVSGAPNAVKSTDGGATWNPIYPRNNFSVAVHPTSPNIVYIGQLNSITKSTDGGATWTGLGGGLGGGAYVAIAIDPVTPTTVYAGTDETGVYKSTDSGANWTSLGPRAGMFNLSVTGIAIDPASPNTVYASGLSGDGTGVYKSIDGGAHWTQTPHPDSALALAINPTTPATLLAGTSIAGMSKTIDGGTSWSVSNGGLVNTTIGAIATDPSSPGTTYAGSALRGDVYRSIDGGTSWTATASPGTNQVYALAVDPTAPGTVYAGSGFFAGVLKSIDAGVSWAPLNSNPHPLNAFALLLDPTNAQIVYAGGPLSGVYRSSNGGASWAVMNNGLPPLVVSMAINPSAPATLYAGLDSWNGPFAGVYKTTNSGGLWSAVNNGLSGPTGAAVVALAVDPTAPNTVYAAVETSGVFKTTNGGTSWTSMNAGLGSLLISSMVMDAALPSTLYVGTRDGGVYVSIKGAASWASANDGLFNLDVRSLASEPGRVYAGTTGDGTFVMGVATVPPSNLLGKSIAIRSPSPGDPSRRKITVVARETHADETLDTAAIAANGATLSIAAFGEVSTSQTYDLPPPWTAVGTTTVKYSDTRGLHGPVTSVVIKKTPAGVFTMTVNLAGNTGSAPQPHIVVVPPNPGSKARAVLTVNGGTSYCVGFGGAAGGSITNSATSFTVTNPTAQACP